MHIKVHTAQLSGQRGEVSPTVCLFAFSQHLCVAFFFFIKSGGLLQAQLVLVLHRLWGVAVSVPNEMFLNSEGTEFYQHFCLNFVTYYLFIFCSNLM